MYYTYTRTLPQNPFRLVPFPTVWLWPLLSPLLPSLFPLVLQSPRSSSRRTQRRSPSRWRSPALSTTTTAVPSAAGPSYLEPWSLLVSSRYCYYHCPADTPRWGVGNQSFSYSSERGLHQEYTCVGCELRYFRNLPLGVTHMCTRKVQNKPYDSPWQIMTLSVSCA